MNKLFILTCIIISLFSVNLHSQDLEATVELNTESLTPEARERLNDFQRQVTDYLNRTKYHQNPIPPIKCTFQFNFTGNNGFDQYTAQIYVYSQREIYRQEDRKSTRLNSSHVKNSYAVFCLKKQTT